MTKSKQTETPADVEELAKAIEDANEIWAVCGQGGIAFRHGPFTKEEVAPLMERAIEEGVGMIFAINVGREIDWAAMKELAPASYTTGGKA